MDGFLRGCRSVLDRVFGDGWGADMLTIVTNYIYDGDRTVEDKIRAGEFVEYNHGSGEYKAGFEFEYPDRIYAFIHDR